MNDDLAHKPTFLAVAMAGTVTETSDVSYAVRKRVSGRRRSDPGHITHQLLGTSGYHRVNTVLHPVRTVCDLE